MNVTFNQINVEFIRDYCIKNNQKEWYNAQIKTTYPCKVYPKGADGKADKTQEKVVEIRPISFIQLKLNFVRAFMPELEPKASAKPSKNMYSAL